MTARNGIGTLHYHNAIKSTTNSAVYMPSSNIKTEPLTEKYSIGEHIGRGKFAVVKKCTNTHTGEVLAAKFIKKRRRGKSCREEILREVVMLEMALEHPRLVNLHEVYETHHELILITEYCAGGELFTECILEEKFDESDVRLLMSQILEGLVYLHDKNIVHLDLKPQNILLTDEFPRGSVKICDLGFACLVNTGEDIRDIIGTPDYVAPEVLNYDPLGLYTDMWSLGVLTYVMLTTCSPFAADDKQLTFSNITMVNLEFSDDLFADISQSAQDFIKQLLKADPEERMTARECLTHEWLADLFEGRIPAVGSCENMLSTSNDNDVELSLQNCEDNDSNEDNSGDYNGDESRNSIDAASILYESSSTLNHEGHQVCRSENEANCSENVASAEKQNTSEEVKLDTREKVVNQHSLMSLDNDETNDGFDKEPAVENSDSDNRVAGADLSAGLEELEHEHIPDSEGDVKHVSESDETLKSGNEVKVIDSSNIGNTSDAQESHEVKLPELTDTAVANTVDYDVTPDTDTSMCISESKSHDLDSGIEVSCETKAPDSGGLTPECSSDKASAEQDLLANEDSVFDEQAGNSEKSTVGLQQQNDSEDTSLNRQDEAADQSNDTPVVISVPDGTESMEMETCDITADSNSELNKSTNAIESSQEANTCVQNKYERVEMRNQSQTPSVNFHDQSLDQSGNSDILMQSFDEFQKAAINFASPPKLNTASPGLKHKFQHNNQTSTPTGPRNSVSNIDDSINSMQLGEKLKRGMCNENAVPGNTENIDEEEYEFISVSKRVRSIEDSMSPRSPPFSSKIPRSPRVSRSRIHPHH